MIVINGEGYQSLNTSYLTKVLKPKMEIICSGGSAYFDGEGILRNGQTKEKISEEDLETFVGKWGAVKAGESCHRFRFS